jgi:ribosomal protein S18 acetylase RimI-like enzyme
MKRPDLKIFSLTDSNLEQGIDLITRLNKRPEHKISYFGESQEEIAEDLKVSQPPDGYGFIAAVPNNGFCGLFGVELDKELGRSWLLGPFVDHEKWDVIADQLYDAIQESLPGEVANQELFFPEENTRVYEFALRHGFEFYSAGAVLTLDAGKKVDLPGDAGQDLDVKYSSQFMDLHEDLFPNTYYSGKQLLKLAEDDDKCLLVHQVDDSIAGYIFIQARESAREGYIDFIGVDKSFRRHGIGRRLAASGINWAFQFPLVEKITLTVKPDNTPAIQLYHNLGFKTQSVSQAYRKQT